MELSIFIIDNFQSSMVYLFPFLVDQSQFVEIMFTPVKLYAPLTTAASPNVILYNYLIGH